MSEIILKSNPWAFIASNLTYLYFYWWMPQVNFACLISPYFAILSIAA
jgi:hypothetical protein